MGEGASDSSSLVRCARWWKWIGFGNWCSCAVMLLVGKGVVELVGFANVFLVK